MGKGKRERGSEKGEGVRERCVVSACLAILAKNVGEKNLFAISIWRNFGETSLHFAISFWQTCVSAKHIVSGGTLPEEQDLIDDDGIVGVDDGEDVNGVVIADGRPGCDAETLMYFMQVYRKQLTSLLLTTELAVLLAVAGMTME